jgi:hypothetical protein
MASNLNVCKNKGQLVDFDKAMQEQDTYMFCGFLGNLHYCIAGIVNLMGKANCFVRSLPPQR